jgi:CBS domain-containing protein
MQVRDVMHTDVVTVSSDTALADAAACMLSHGISGVPVVGPTGSLAGIVTEGDFLRRAELGTERHRKRWLEFFTSNWRLTEDYVQSHARRVEEIMSTPVATIAEDAPLEHAVALMLARKIKRLPVVRGDALVGIVSRADLLRAFAARAAEGATPAAAPDDTAIAATIAAQLDAQAWAANGAVRVDVKDGVARLHGTIFDEGERLAARVLAENVAGVKAVEDQLVWIEPLSGTVIDWPEDSAAKARDAHP